MTGLPPPITPARARTARAEAEGRIHAESNQALRRQAAALGIREPGPVQAGAAEELAGGIAAQNEGLRLDIQGATP